MNRIELFKRPNQQLELVVNGITIDDLVFNTTDYDSTAREQIDMYIASEDGQRKLKSINWFDTDITMTFNTNDNSDEFDGTNQHKITFIDQSA
jgi:hypothetical protein